MRKAVAEPGLQITAGDAEAPVPVIAGGSRWLVVEVDKPYGISIHNDSGRDACSLTVINMGRHLQSIRGYLGLQGEI